MNSRTAQFAARLIETGWLAAVVVTPVFFNVWSSRVFEPDKLTLLRSIALIMLVAGLIVIYENRHPVRGLVRRAVGVPLVAPVLLLTGVYVLATSASIVPFISITGSYDRLQGLYTWCAYVVVFLALVALLRQRDQLQRLVGALIVTSLPVALYGVVQKFGRDPMPWLGRVDIRVASTLGNSIFVAAYLILVVPLTVVKLREAYFALDDERNQEGWAPVLRLSAYIVLLVVQLLAIVLSQSRGPILGLLAGLFFLLLVLALWRGRRAMLSVLALGGAAAAFLVVFNLPSSPLAPLRDVQYVGRMGQVFETDSGTGRVRVLIWRGAIDLITSDPPRTLIGYGPESMHAAYSLYYPPELAQLESRNASPDRSHNETLDALAQTGVLGFLAYMYLFTSLFYFGLKWLGLIGTARERGEFLGLWFGGGILAVLGFQAWAGDATFFGVALPAGMVAGLFAFVALRAVTGWTPPDRPGLPLIAGLLATLVAHFVEIHFGIAIAATRTVFFVCAGALVVAGALSEERPGLFAGQEPSATAPARLARRKRGRRARDPGATFKSSPWLASAFTLLLVLVTLSFDFIVTPSPGDKLGIMVWLIGLTWALGALLLASEIQVGRGGARSSGLWAFLGTTAGGTLLYALLHWLVLASGQPGADGTAPRDGAATSSMLLWLYYAALLTVLTLWALVLMRGDRDPGPLVSRRFAYAYPLALGAAMAVALLTNVNEVRADIYYKQAWQGYHEQANAYQRRGQLDLSQTYFGLAEASYARARALDPREDRYLLFTGKVLLEKADALSDAADRTLGSEAGAPGFSEYEVADPVASQAVRDRDAAFNEAIAALMNALESARHNPDHYANLARAYQVWGDRTFEAAHRAERLQESREWFGEATAQSPQNAQLLDEWAMTEYLDGDIEEARALVAQAFELDPRYGRPHRLLGRMAMDEGDLEAAEASYRAYVDSRDGRKDPGGWSTLALVLGRQDKLEGAIAANEQVLGLFGDDVDTLRNLGILATQVGDPVRGCDWVVRGLDLAPGDDGLRQLADDLGCSVPAP